MATSALGDLPLNSQGMESLNVEEEFRPLSLLSKLPPNHANSLGESDIPSFSRNSKDEEEIDVSNSAADVANSGAIRVYLRVRPLSEREIDNSAKICLVANEKEARVTLVDAQPAKNFTYDYVANESSTQEDVFQRVGKPICDQCLNGFNGTVFAYGQTGSGKTHTLGARRTVGPSSGSCSSADEVLSLTTRSKQTDAFTIQTDDGLMPRVFSYLFDQIERRTRKSGGKLNFLIKLSFLEIYNEKIFDLLDTNMANGLSLNVTGSNSSISPAHPSAPSGGSSLLLREDIRRGVYVEGLNEESVRCASDCMNLMLQGLANRRVGETLMNRESSRSHCILSLTIQSTELCREGAKIERFSRFNLVDLAGSERQRGTGAHGTRLKEAGQINKSLSDLGNVINALSLVSQAKTNNENGTPSIVGNAAAIRRHIPYRNSKLTFILKDSLGGNSLTCLIACVSPAADSFGETLSTLQFAARAKRVRNRVHANEDVLGTSEQLQKENAKLREELRQLQLKLTERLEIVVSQVHGDNGNNDGDQTQRMRLSFGTSKTVVSTPAGKTSRTTLPSTPRRFSRGPVFASSGVGDASGGFGLDASYPWEQMEVAELGKLNTSTDMDDDDFDNDDDEEIERDQNFTKKDEGLLMKTTENGKELSFLVDFIETEQEESKREVKLKKRKQRLGIGEPEFSGPFIPVSDAQVLLTAVRESATREREWNRESDKLRQRVQSLIALKERLEQLHLNDTMALNLRKQTISQLTEALEKKIDSKDSNAAQLTELVSQIVRYVKEEEPLLQEKFINHPHVLDKQIELKRLNEELEMANKRFNAAKQFICEKALLNHPEAKDLLIWPSDAQLPNSLNKEYVLHNVKSSSVCKDGKEDENNVEKYFLDPNLRLEFRTYAALIYMMRQKQKLQLKFDSFKERVFEKPIAVWTNDWSEEQRQRVRDYDMRMTDSNWNGNSKKLEDDLASSNAKLTELEVLLAARTAELEALRGSNDKSSKSTKVQRQAELISALEMRMTQLIQVNAELTAKLKEQLAKPKSTSDQSQEYDTQSESQNLRMQIAQYTATIAQLRQNIDDSTRRESALQQECELLTREVQLRTRESIELASETERLRDECELLQHELFRNRNKDNSLNTNDVQSAQMETVSNPSPVDLEEHRRLRLLATDLSARLSEANQHNIQLQAQFEAANQANIAGQAQVSELIEQLALRDKMSNALREDVHSAVQSRQELSRKVRELTMEVETARARIAAQESDVLRNALGNEIRALEARLSVADRTAAEARLQANIDRAAKEDALAQLQDLQKASERETLAGNAQSELEMKVNELENQVKYEQEKVNRLLTNSEKEQSRLTILLEVAESRTCSLENEITSSKQELAHVTAQLEELKKRCEEQSLKEEELQLKIDSFESAQETMKKQVTQSNRDAAAAIVQAKLAEAEEARSQSKLQEVEAELSRLREINMRTENELKTLSEAYAKAEEQVSSLSGHQNSKQRISILQRLKTENNELRERVSELEKKMLTSGIKG